MFPICSCICSGYRLSSKDILIVITTVTQPVHSRVRLVAQSCPALCDAKKAARQTPLSMGILQAKILEWVSTSSSRGSSQLRDPTRSSALQVDSKLPELPGKLKNTGVGSLPLLHGNFPNQESNWGLLHCRQILYQLSYQGRPSTFMGSTKTDVDSITCYPTKPFSLL